MKDLGAILRYARPYWAALLGAVVLMAIAAAAHAMTALLVGPVFDRVLNPASADEPVLLLTVPLSGAAIYLHDLVPGWIHNVWTTVAFLIVAVFLTKGLADYAGNYLVNYVGLSAVADLRQRIFDKLLRQDSAFFESLSTGRLMSAVMNDVEKIQVATSHILADWLRQSFSAIALLYVVLRMDWKLALVSLTVVPFVLIPTLRIGRRIRRSTRRAQDDAGELNQILQEALSGLVVVKSFARERYESERFQAAARRLRRSTLRYVAQQAMTSPLIEFFGALTIVGLLTYARQQIKTGQLTTGEFTSFVIALLMLYEPVKRLTGIHNIFQQAIGAAQTVLGYLRGQETVRNRPGATALPPFTDAIEFDNVTFRYPSADQDVLRGIRLRIRAGEMVALVGPSGAGKSTLSNLIPRFFDPTGGAVRIDGRDLRDVTLESLRSQVGIVAQDTFLFNDTVANNIRYGCPAAAADAVRAAARAALADEFIERLPQGYDTIVGERGTKLSGGQRQRIAIARALLKNAPILILDEATSHLDTESEALVQQAVMNLIAGRTVLVIAHRLSTVRRADTIVVLDAGRITEIGTHDDLIGGGGIYQRLHALQFLDKEVATARGDT